MSTRLAVLVPFALVAMACSSADSSGGVELTDSEQSDTQSVGQDDVESSPVDPPDDAAARNDASASDTSDSMDQQQGDTVSEGDGVIASDITGPEPADTAVIDDGAPGADVDGMEADGAQDTFEEDDVLLDAVADDADQSDVLDDDLGTPEPDSAEPGEDSVAFEEDGEVLSDADGGEVPELPEPEPDPSGVDNDGDGYCEGVVLDDSAELTCSDGSEPGDCDDEDPSLQPADVDEDGYSTCALDCDDADSMLHPGDWDGDGYSTCADDCDDDDPSLTPVDLDGDGVTLCQGDCDDNNPEIYPGGPEVAHNGIDDDCDPATFDDDADGDGWPEDEDCDDANPAIHPWAVEVPDNGVDENCDGEDSTLLDQDGLDLLGGDDGIITEDSVLEPGLTHFITGDLVVPIGTTLVIGPGTELVFQGPYRVIVHGTLMVVGASDAPVVFTSDDPTPGSWVGIEFNNTGSGVLAHVEISYAERGVYIEEATIALTHVHVHDCVTGVFIEGTGASPTLLHVTADNNQTGIVCSWAGWTEEVFINYSTITHNVDGILGSGSCGLRLWNSVIGYNENRGLLSDGSTLWHNHFIGNGLGIETAGGWDSLTRNVIELNGTGASLGPYPVRVNLNLNHLLDNDAYSVVYVGGNDDGAVNAERNWWGSASGLAIGPEIWDFFDDVSLYYVDYIPFLRQPLTSVGPIPWGIIDDDGDHFFSVYSGGNDCDDTNAAIHPDAPDDQLNGVDDDCDGYTDEDAPIDHDGDGYVFPDDCDLLDPTIHPNAHEIVDDGIDQNCNGYDMVSLSPMELTAGVIPTDAYLTPDLGTYVISGDIYVAPEMVLRLGPGTHVRFDGYWSIIVYGTLEVDGKSGDEVVIDSLSSAPEAGDWNRIWINDIGSGFMRHARVEHASSGVYIEDSAYLIEHTTLSDCETGLVVDGTEATVNVEHSTIEQNQLAVEASWSGWDEPIKLAHSIIRQNNNGIIATGSANLDLWSCDLDSNQGVALESDGGVFQHCRVANNGVGIRTKGGWDTIQYNLFEDNVVGLEVGAYPKRPSVRYNAFGPHSEYAVVYVGGADDGPVDATMCWWGSTEAEVIGDKIWDIFDDPALFPVEVHPTLDEPHPSVGLVPEGVVDNDMDGFFSEETGGADCDDNNSLTNPYGDDTTLDGVDNDCDGEVDEDVLTDSDNDTFWSDVDCDDADPTSYPGADEVADNGVDEDCDGYDLKTVTDDEFEGLVDRDLVFTANESPYVITGDIVVMPGYSMFVEEGATLRFDGPWTLTVKGELLVTGSPGAPALFTADGENFAPGAWRGIVAESTSEVKIEQAIIAWADIGVSIIDCEADVLDTEIRDCLEGVRVDGTEATATLSGLYVHHNGVGINGYWAGWQNAIDLVNSTITANSDGIMTSGSTGLFISGCTITDNTGVGAMLSGNVIMLSLISGNGTGIITAGGWDEITLNEIISNGVGLEIGPYPERPQIKNNTIMGNTTYGLFYVGGGVDGPVDATENWWGSDDAAAITGAIWDLYDDINLFEVLWSPPLSGPNPDAGLSQP